MFVSKGSQLLALGIVAAVVLLAACSANPDIFAAYINADGRTIELNVDTCNADLSADVVEADTTVEVTVMAENDTADDCADGVTITLDEPLGDRRLINGSTGEVLPVVPGEN